MLQGLQVGSAAHVKTLRRDRIGDYLVEDAWPLHDFVERARASLNSSDGDAYQKMIHGSQ